MSTPTPQTTATLLIDGHVHIYPFHNWAKAIESLLANLAPQNKTLTIRIGLLAESRSCHFFQEVIANPAAFQKDNLRLEAGPGSGTITIRQDNKIVAYLIAGRQIVTAEKLEILALGSDVAVPDGLPAEETLTAILQGGAVPVLSWAAGKWFFGRGKVIKSLASNHPPGHFLMGDTALRPIVWPLPDLMKFAFRRGFKMIGGSDPLPLANEEIRLGSYGFSITTELFDGSDPDASLRRLLNDPNGVFTPIGNRCCPFTFTSLWIRNQFRKR